MFKLLIILSFVIILIFIIKFFLDKKSHQTPSSNNFPYQRNKYLLSKSERSFFGLLEKLIGESHKIFCKVRLADIISVKKGLNQKTWHSAFNRIKSKHIDFVVCSPDTLEIKYAIELDDSSHSKKPAQLRDNFVDQALQKSNIKIYRFNAKYSYSLDEIKDTLPNF